MNADTILALYGGTARNQIPQLALASTTETAFSVNTDTGTTTAFLTFPTQTGIVGSSNPLDYNANPAVLGPAYGRQWGRVPGAGAPWYNSGSFDKHPFRVRLTGVGNAGANAAQSAIINLYQGTSTTLGSDTIIATTGAALAMVAGGAFTFVIEATCIWDSTLQVLGGTFTAALLFTNKAGSQVTTQATLTNWPSVTSVAGLSFLASAKMGNGAASTVNVSEFAFEQI